MKPKATKSRSLFLNSSQSRDDLTSSHWTRSRYLRIESDSGLFLWPEVTFDLKVVPGICTEHVFLNPRSPCHSDYSELCGQKSIKKITTSRMFRCHFPFMQNFGVYCKLFCNRARVNFHLCPCNAFAFNFISQLPISYRKWRTKTINLRR